MSWHLQSSADRPIASSPARKLSPPASFGPAKLLAGLAAAAGLAGCASPGSYNPARLPVAELGQVQQVCHSVMGIAVGTGLMADCVGNLSMSAAALGQGHAQALALQDARRACLGRGLAPGQPALAECELNTTADHITARAQLASVTVDAGAAPQRPKSYASASFGEVRRREQAACARIGYEPADAQAFASCVNSLDAALYASEHPPQ